AGVFDHREEQRMRHRLAAGERQIRNAERHHLLERSEHLRLVELVAEALPRAALLDAVHAREVAFVGDLPSHVQRRAQPLGGRGGRFVASRLPSLGTRDRHGLQSSTRPLLRRSLRNERTSCWMVPASPLQRSTTRTAIWSSSPPAAISRTTAAAVGFSVKTFSDWVSNSTPPNFSSLNFTYFESFISCLSEYGGERVHAMAKAGVDHGALRQRNACAVHKDNRGSCACGKRQRRARVALGGAVWQKWTAAAVMRLDGRASRRAPPNSAEPADRFVA